MLLQNGYKKIFLALALTASVLNPALPGFASGHAVSIGVVNPLPPGAVSRIHVGSSKRFSRTPTKAGPYQHKKPVAGKTKESTTSKAGKTRSGKKAMKQQAAATLRSPLRSPLRPPQDELGFLTQTSLAPGVVHKFHRGPLNINIIDVDLSNPNIEVKPVLASNTFNRLDEVRDQAQRVNAIAAVNANYFKKDGTPLGTLVVDGEWVAGPLYDRISFGLTDSGQVHVDRTNLHGTIETSNPSISTLWVNNINQPRRSGCKLVAYTRRWGAEVKMAYAGCLVSVDSSGKVLDKTTQNISIPYGGFVLSDTKYSVISKLKRGDLVSLEWHHRPDAWANVVQAVSGGPALIKNGKLFLDLKDENFRKAWTSNKIHARTALGVTRNHHLILATVEGPHTLWDLAKMLHKLGCVEAMNLDGGGSTTMVVRGNIVTRNKNSFQRRVAASLAVLPRSQAPSLARQHFANYVPKTDLSSAFSESSSTESCLLQIPVADPIANEIQQRLLNNEPALPELANKDSAPGVKTEENQVAQPVLTNDPESRSNKKKQKLKKTHGRSLEFNNWMKGWLGK